VQDAYTYLFKELSVDTQTLNEFLKEKTKSKETFSFIGLKKSYPKEKKQIEKLKFIGLINIDNVEFPDQVQAFIYN
jgi:hypothetical protein